MTGRISLVWFLVGNTSKKNDNIRERTAAYTMRSPVRFAKLQEADLRSANLQEANLGGAKLQEAVLRSANLQEADLGFANLQEANQPEEIVATAAFLASDDASYFTGADLVADGGMIQV